MRRAAMVVALSLLACVPARAQVLIGALAGDKLASETFNLGFEVGLDFSTLDGLSGAERIKHPVFGLFADWRFSEHLHFTGAFLPIGGRGASNLHPVPTGDPAIDGQTGGAPATRTLSTIEFPLRLHWAPKRDSGFRAGAGASFAIITGANDRYEVPSASGTYVLERDVGDLLPGLDFGIGADVEWRFKMLAIAVRYTHGLTDLRLPGETDAVHSRVLTGTGRIALGRKRAAP
jgi:hypothetical protein